MSRATVVTVSLEQWPLKFHASSGRTYLLSMGTPVSSLGGDDRPRPVALVESPDGSVRAMYPDPRDRATFTSIQDFAADLGGVVLNYETIDDTAN